MADDKPKTFDELLGETKGAKEVKLDDAKTLRSKRYKVFCACGCEAPVSTVTRLVREISWSCSSCEDTKKRARQAERARENAVIARAEEEAESRGVGASQKALEKVTRLIQLASSSNENEAAASAKLACKIIRESGLSLVTPETVENMRKMVMEREMGVPWRFR